MRALTSFAGSKRRLLKHYLGFFPTDKHFLDLFAGSGIVAANTEAPSKHLNEIRSDWLAVLQTLTDDTDNFVDAYTDLTSWVKGKDEYFLLLDKLPSLTGLEYSAGLLIAQKCCFGGIPSYGKHGHFRQGFAQRPKNLDNTQLIYDYAEGLKGATFSARSWEEVPFRGFVFADPPYRTFYKDPVSYHTEINHEDLAEALKAHGSFAYCGTDLGDGWLDEHFAGYNRLEVPIKHTAKRAGADAVKEVLVYA